MDRCPISSRATKNAAALIGRQIEGPIPMLNLLRFRDIADCAADPEPGPDEPISGAEAYRRYAQHTMPYVLESGSEVESWYLECLGHRTAALEDSLLLPIASDGTSA